MKITTELNIKFVLFTIEDVKINSSSIGYEQLEACAKTYFEQYTLPLSEIPGVQNARNLFRQLKIDPTRHRPSSEALLRRAMKQKDLYSVNNLVDVCNWCALDFLLPNGVYDLNKIRGNIVLREGLENEFYEGLNNRQVNLHDRYCLADDNGVFGSPITDSKRTCVDEHTTNAFAIIYAPDDFDQSKLEEYKEIMINRIEQFCR